jgi:Amidohydrolase family
LSTYLLRTFSISLALGTACTLATAQQQNVSTTASGPTVYFGGDILTMRGTEPEYVESLAVKEGKIVFAGARAESQKLLGPNAKSVDLGGKTLLPGFIDTHGHFVYFGKNLVDANLFNCVDIPELIARMKKQVEQTPQGAWIVGFGYQARAMKEGRPPTSEELDQISTDLPVMDTWALRTLLLLKLQESPQIPPIQQEVLLPVAKTARAC